MDIFRFCYAFLLKNIYIFLRFYCMSVKLFHDFIWLFIWVWLLFWYSPGGKLCNWTKEKSPYVWAQLRFRMCLLYLSFYPFLKGSENLVFSVLFHDFDDVLKTCKNIFCLTGESEATSGICKNICHFLMRVPPSGDMFYLFDSRMAPSLSKNMVLGGSKTI